MRRFNKVRIFLLLALFLSFAVPAWGQQTYTVDGTFPPTIEPDIDHYDVSRGPTGGPYVLSSIVPVGPTPAFNEVGLSGSNCWIAEAVNTAGLKGEASDEACMFVPGKVGGITLTVTITIP